MSQCKSSYDCNEGGCCSAYYSSVGGKPSDETVCIPQGTAAYGEVNVPYQKKIKYNGPTACVQMAYAAGASQLYVTTAVAATAMYMM